MRQKSLAKLKILYFFIFVLGAVIIVPTHIFPPPAFMYARFPHYLEMMKPIVGISWSVSFKIYHWIFLIIGVIAVINVLGLVFSNIKHLARLSSLIGLFLFSSMVLFFFFIFITVNAPTAIVYGVYSLLLLTVDLLTFFSLNIGKKRQ